MHLRSCENPKRVYNKYIDDYVWVGCGECPSCKRRRAARWISRLEAERREHIVSMFVTLTYDNAHLPRLVFDGHSDLVSQDGRICIPFEELDFSSSADADLFRAMMAQGGISYADVRDVQKFHKRLNKYFYEKVSHHYKNFRYFTVSEFGSTTLRPHFHCIYFLDSWEVANRFEEAVNETWKNGIVDVQYIESSATSYVANYLNELFSLPSFYTHCKIRPFFLCSRRPAIGSRNELSASDEQIFNECIVEQLQPGPPGTGEITSVPLLSCTANRLFPKLPFYRLLPCYCHAQLYGLAGRPLRACQQSFSIFLDVVKGFLRLDPTHADHDIFHNYLSCIAEGFSERGINRLKRVYYISKRVLRYAHDFGVSLQTYCEHIDRFWSKYELLVLNKFYKFQQDYSRIYDLEDLAVSYPEYMYQNGYSDEADNYVKPLNEIADVRVQKEESSAWRNLNLKTHFKNAYFNSLKDRHDPMYKPLLNYYYAKKCNEIIEAHGELCPT